MKLQFPITHRTMQPYLKQLQREPEFQPGPNAPINRNAWYRTQVYLEFPTGELCNGFLSRLALCGTQEPELLPIDGKESLNAQGLEGKARVRKDLFGALMNLRDILPEHRGRIVSAGAEVER